MGKLIPTSQRIVAQSKKGTLYYQTEATPKKKIPGFNQNAVFYMDTDGKRKWAAVDTDEFGGILYGGRRFANADDLIPTLLTPVQPTPAPTTVTTPAKTTPKPVKPVTAFSRDMPQVSAPENLRNSPAAAPVRAVVNYGAKALSGVGAAFANLAGRAAEVADTRREIGVRALEQLKDEARVDYYGRYYGADDGRKEKALKAYQARLALYNQAKKQPETAKEISEAFYGISDKLADQSAQFQEAAEKNLPDVPALRGVLNAVTGLVPFFALNAIPVAGQAAAGPISSGNRPGRPDAPD